ncbi:putative O-methyltransferase YrrM [Microbacteriaceae bacterium SG_E_30_P1]|uniref:O-methyltransferase YrrM n=1 Tax=Antiquaquibacter oligotrophicus TaxID=2880260 RepID=A0ABT6KK90_9MICO|nr:O-methyltransferase [Antiquaquibacter oligotrophicus]MDH6180403.1 putative O-methyltransferase YrrM [Antiquaquibacter oligotrophicus]UDF13857.1 O-methyltransferase [Antiquaquibacter oligotrophicus]
MSDKKLSLKFAEDSIIEPEVIAAARTHSLELGVEPVTPAVGSHLALLAAATGAKTIIEVGTGVGVSGLWLLRGAPDAVLTTIDIEVDHQQSARQAFADAGIAAKQTRLITGRASDVLPRMNEGSYDIAFIDADSASILDYVQHGLRMVRTGGTVIVAHALWRGRVADPAQRDETVANFRLLLKETLASDAVLSALSPVGDGLLMLTKVGE